MFPGKPKYIPFCGFFYVLQFAFCSGELFFQSYRQILKGSLFRFFSTSFGSPQPKTFVFISIFVSPGRQKSTASMSTKGTNNVPSKIKIPKPVAFQVWLGKNLWDRLHRLQRYSSLQFITFGFTCREVLRRLVTDNFDFRFQWNEIFWHRPDSLLIILYLTPFLMIGDSCKCLSNNRKAIATLIQHFVCVQSTGRQVAGNRAVFFSLDLPFCTVSILSSNNQFEMEKMSFCDYQQKCWGTERFLSIPSFPIHAVNFWFWFSDSFASNRRLNLILLSLTIFFRACRCSTLRMQKIF